MIITNSINNIFVAEFFSLNEFQCPCCCCVKLHSLLLQKLKGLRYRIKKPVIITSGYRCPKYNMETGGVKNSYHLLGMAADIYVPGISLAELLQVAREFGFQGIGFYPRRNFLHLDIRATDQQVYWQG
jgi:uncharacterized protein YcbK (DUF882 family)